MSWLILIQFVFNCTMAIPVVEFSSEGYNIRNNFGLRSNTVNYMTDWCLLSRMRVAILFKSIFCDLKTSKCEFFSKRENKGLKRSKRQIELQIAKECLIFLLALTFESKDKTKRQRLIIQHLKMRYETVTVFLLSLFINTIQGPPWITF